MQKLPISKASIIYATKTLLDEINKNLLLNNMPGIISNITRLNELSSNIDNGDIMLDFTKIIDTANLIFNKEEDFDNLYHIILNLDSKYKIHNELFEPALERDCILITKFNFLQNKDSDKAYFSVMENFRLEHLKYFMTTEHFQAFAKDREDQQVSNILYHIFENKYYDENRAGQIIEFIDNFNSLLNNNHKNTYKKRLIDYLSYLNSSVNSGKWSTIKESVLTYLIKNDLTPLENKDFQAFLQHRTSIISNSDRYSSDVELHNCLAETNKVIYDLSLNKTDKKKITNI